MPHGGSTAIYCELVHDGLIAQCWRKDFSKSERIDYARRLERIESLKAEKRMRAGKFDPCQKSDEGKRTDEIVSEKIGIGSRDTYRKEKFIVDNQACLSPEEFADWDEGKLNSIIPHKLVKSVFPILETHIMVSLN